MGTCNLNDESAQNLLTGLRGLMSTVLLGARSTMNLQVFRAKNRGANPRREGARGQVATVDLILPAFRQPTAKWSTPASLWSPRPYKLSICHVSRVHVA